MPTDTWFESPLRKEYNALFVSCTWSNTLAVCTPGMWKNCITHCETLIQNDWEKLIDTIPIADIPPIIISLADSDDE
jgi:DNA mismatch repair protein MutH